MVINDTLLVRHLPSELSHKEKEEFLKHFGAAKVKILGSEKKKTNLVYAKYESHEAAQVALKRLHQLEVLGHLLSVELARGNNEVCESSDVSSHMKQFEKQDHIRRPREAFFQKLNSWTKLIDLNYPPPHHLQYQYSPPTRQVLDNICKALTNVPKFYTQVLHLMNKINLPCPFTDNYPLHSTLIEDRDVKQFVDEKKEVIAESETEEESEIESDPDERPVGQNKETNIVQLKRKKTSQNPLKRPKFVKPVVTANTQPKPALKAEEVFEKVDKDPLQRKIELKLTPGLVSIQESTESQSTITNEGFGIKHSIAKSSNITEDSNLDNIADEENIETCITEEALTLNRIPAKDLRVLPVFKNYQAGVPSCRLYIKNLAKHVIAKDLHFIYRRFTIPQTDDQGNMFDIRLMQEGRMKGQAFVSLQNIELAQKALKETNGYILKDKPMVVQFARSSATK